MPKIYLSQLDQLWIKVNTQSVVCGRRKEKNTIELYTLEMTHILLYAINSFFPTIHNRTGLSSANFFFILLLFHSVFCASQKISKNENISGSAMKWNSIYTIESSSSSNNSVDHTREKKLKGLKSQNLCILGEVREQQSTWMLMFNVISNIQFIWIMTFRITQQLYVQAEDIPGHI
jgi:hypothetical protein